MRHSLNNLPSWSLLSPAPGAFLPPRRRQRRELGGRPLRHGPVRTKGVVPKENPRRRTILTALSPPFAPDTERAGASVPGMPILRRRQMRASQQVIVSASSWRKMEKIAMTAAKKKKDPPSTTTLIGRDLWTWIHSILSMTRVSLSALGDGAMMALIDCPTGDEPL